MTVHILCDIDGVISPLGIVNEPFGDIKHDWGTWRIPISNAKWLIELFKRTHFVWASTWGSESNDISRVLASRDHPFLLFRNNIQGEWLKANDARSYINNLPREDIVIWIDDEFTEDTLKEYEDDENVFIVHTNPDTGLTERDRSLVISIISHH